MKRAIFYMQDTFSTGHVRGIVPAGAMNREGGSEWRMDVKTDFVYSDLSGTAVMVFSRFHDQTSLNWMGEAQRRGIRCVYDVDDDLFCVPKGFASNHEGGGDEVAEMYARDEVRGNMRAFLQAADAVTVCTPELAASLQEHAPDAAFFVVRNGIFPDMWAGALGRRLDRLRRGGDGVTIGWHASGAHNVDAPLVAEAVARVMAGNGHVRLNLFGWAGVFDALRDRLGTAAFAERVKVGGWVKIGGLPDAIGEFDIGLAPLVDSRFNRGKSFIKWLEYAALMIPCVASNLPVYAEAIAPDRSGVLVGPDPEKWFQALEWLANDGTARWCLGASAHAAMREKHTDVDMAAAWRRVLDCLVERNLPANRLDLAASCLQE